MSGLYFLGAGGTQADKTTLLNCLSAAIPTRERVVTAEEVFELKIPLPDVVALQCRQPNLEGTGEIKLRRLVKEALRMRPSRIVVGEVRREESLDLLIALSPGLQWQLGTPHHSGTDRQCQPDQEDAGREAGSSPLRFLMHTRLDLTRASSRRGDGPLPLTRLSRTDRKTPDRWRFRLRRRQLPIRP